MNRVHARFSVVSVPATAFTTSPEPRTIGSFARGKQLIAGEFILAGHQVDARDESPWGLRGLAPSVEEGLHGFTWLDDLAAVGDGAARRRAQSWTWDWIDRYRRGSGPGWSPDLTGRRLIRWINHAIFLLNGRESGDSQAYFRMLAQQTAYLARRWHTASPGLPRFEALTGLIYAGLALTGMDVHVRPAIKALARECAERIDNEGGIPSRNPEELLEVFTLLNWAASALSEGGRMAERDHLLAIERIAPTLRALRHADGGLARYHGGGRGREGRLDHALASSGVRAAAHPGLSMGFARLSAGRSSLIVDAAAPPRGIASFGAHASTLAFELTSGRRPLIVNCGSGESFGEKWRRAGRATQSHSTLCVEGYSSSRLGPKRVVGAYEREVLVDIPRDVRVQTKSVDGVLSIHASHDGYAATHGLTHLRTLRLSSDARGVAGDDTLAAVADTDRAQFDRALQRTDYKGVPFTVRFHLHPDVDAELDLGGTAVSMVLKSGEVWVFRHDGTAELAVTGSVYLEKERVEPRPTRQVVLSATAMNYATRVRWSLAKAQDTPSAVRDFAVDDDEEIET